MLQPVLEPQPEVTQGNGRLRHLFENYAFDTDGEEQRLIKTLPEP